MRTLAALTPASSANRSEEIVVVFDSAASRSDRRYTGRRATVASGIRRLGRSGVSPLAPCSTILRWYRADLGFHKDTYAGGALSLSSSCRIFRSSQSRPKIVPPP